MTTLRQVTRNVSWTACLLAIAGCQTTLPLDAMKQPTFAVGQVVSVPATAVSTAGNALAGSLTVSFQGVLAAARQRRVLATVADVDHVTVTVKAADGATQTQTVAKAAIVNGQTTVTFTGLAIGNAEVTTEAYDATGNRLGATTKPALVSAGQVATVDVALQLSPTYAGTPGGGGASSTTGGLAATIALLEGAAVPATHSGQLLGQFVLPNAGRGVGVDSAGNAWVGMLNFGVPGSSRLLKVSPSGETLLSLPIGAMLDFIFVDKDDHIWAVDSGAQQSVYEVAQDGTILHQYPNHAVNYIIDAAIDENGNLYLLNSLTDGASLERITPQGDHSSYALAGGAGHSYRALAVSPFGEVWVTQWADSTANATVKRVSSAGLSLADVELQGVPANQLILLNFDSTGKAWVLSGSVSGAKFSQYNSQGTWLATSTSDWSGDSQLALESDGVGGMWFFQYDRAVHIDSQGAPIASTSLSSPLAHCVVHRTGVWATSINAVTEAEYKLYRLAP